MKPATAPSFSVCRAVFASFATVASCERSEPTFVTSCVPIKWFSVSTADLHVVPDDAGTAPTRRHRAGVRIGERDLLVGRGEHLFLDRREALHLPFEFREFFLEPLA